MFSYRVMAYMSALPGEQACQRATDFVVFWAHYQVGAVARDGLIILFLCFEGAGTRQDLLRRSLSEYPPGSQTVLELTPQATGR